MLSYIVNLIGKVIRWICRSRRFFKEACRNISISYKSFNLDTPVRLGSTYKLLRDTYIYREIMFNLYNNTMGENILTRVL